MAELLFSTVVAILMPVVTSLVVTFSSDGASRAGALTMILASSTLCCMALLFSKASLLDFCEAASMVLAVTRSATVVAMSMLSDSVFD